MMVGQAGDLYGVRKWRPHPFATMRPRKLSLEAGSEHLQRPPTCRSLQRCVEAGSEIWAVGASAGHA